jgi:hypothetical protein
MSLVRPVAKIAFQTGATGIFNGIERPRVQVRTDTECAVIDLLHQAPHLLSLLCRLLLVGMRPPHCILPGKQWIAVASLHKSRERYVAEPVVAVLEQRRKPDF